jgi:hypothetical protein
LTAVLRLLASPDVIAALGSPVARKARCLLREYWGRDRGRMPEPESEPGLPPRGHGTGAPSPSWLSAASLQCGEAEAEEEDEELRRLDRRRWQHLQGLRCRRALLSSRQRQLTVAQCRQQEEGAEVGLVHDPRQSATDDVAAEHRWRMLRASEAVLAPRQQQPLGVGGGSGTVRGAVPLHAQPAVVAARESAACLRSERDALRARVEAQAAVVDQERREHTATVVELRASTEERVVEERRAHDMAVAQLEAEAVAATEALAEAEALAIRRATTLLGSYAAQLEEAEAAEAAERNDRVELRTGRRAGLRPDRRRQAREHGWRTP